MPSTVQVTSVDNKNWSSYRKLWRKHKIVRRQSEELKEDDSELSKLLKNEEIEISRKLVEIAKTLTDGKGNPIPIPFFAVLGSNQ